MTLHPQAAAFLRTLEEQNPPTWPDLGPEQGREIFAGLTELFGSGPQLHRVEDHTLGGVSVRTYRADDSNEAPVILYMHGGGWVLGDLESHDVLCRRLAERSGCVVVAIDYRRSPEIKFPGAVEDCIAVLNAVWEQSAELNINRDKIVLAGDSAGGNLAAAVAIHAGGNFPAKVLYQVLIYPVLDCRCDTDSYRQFAEGYGLSETTMKWFWEQYLEKQADGTNGLASPLQAHELSGLPPTHVITAEYDVLRDEGEEFAQRLEASGVPTTHRRYDGMLHGFVHFSGVFDQGLTALNDIAELIRSHTR